jgi:NTP pyrophosphatase (non-canonical NTP hydrolase)
MNEQVKEALMILQEECAEVTQAISKIFRFGMDTQYPQGAPTNKEKLEEEVGDLLAMVDILIQSGALSDSHVNQCRSAKKSKLKLWSKHN